MAALGTAILLTPSTLVISDYTFKPSVLSMSALLLSGTSSVITGYGLAGTNAPPAAPTTGQLWPRGDRTP